jgi:hypothetical protein
MGMVTTSDLSRHLACEQNAAARHSLKQDGAPHCGAVPGWAGPAGSQDVQSKKGAKEGSRPRK